MKVVKISGRSDMTQMVVVEEFLQAEFLEAEESSPSLAKVLSRLADAVSREAMDGVLLPASRQHILDEARWILLFAWIPWVGERLIAGLAQYVVDRAAQDKLP